jgi:N-acetylneuraminate synthase
VPPGSVRPVFVIAEAGVNHDGSLERALALVDAAADAGADAVKFQTFRADELASAEARSAAYQARNTGATSQREMLRALELDEAAHRALARRCRERGLEFMSTAFDPASLALLTGMGVRRLKIPSGEITNPLLLEAVARTGLPVILSTGMCTLEEVREALGMFAAGCLPAAVPPLPASEALARAEVHAALSARVTLLHCTTEYPAPVDEVNLRAMQTMADAFGLPVGYSDHTQGIAIPIAAAALGAVLVEKHFTLDRRLPGPDHKASLEPGELRDMVAGIRAVERALGTGRKEPTASELPNRAVARRSLVAARAIRAGEPFTRENLTVRRPGTGISASRYGEWLGRVATRPYAADELIEP